MRAHNLLRTLRHRRDLGDRDGARVRAEHRLRLADPIKLPENLLLDLQLLEDRLDHDVGLGRRLQLRGHRDPPDRRFRVVSADRPLRRELLQRPADPLQTPLRRRLIKIAQRDLPPGLGRHLCYPRAHQSGTDNRKLLRHDPTLTTPNPALSVGILVRQKSETIREDLSECQDVPMALGPLIALVMMAMLAAILHRSLRGGAAPKPAPVRALKTSRLSDCIADDYGLLATAAVTRTHADALLIKEHLRSAGIRATLANAPDGQIRVLVFGDEVVQARRLVG